MATGGENGVDQRWYYETVMRRDALTIWSEAIEEIFRWTEATPGGDTLQFTLPSDRLGTVYKLLAQIISMFDVKKAAPAPPAIGQLERAQQFWRVLENSKHFLPSFRDRGCFLGPSDLGRSPTGQLGRSALYARLKSWLWELMGRRVGNPEQGFRIIEDLQSKEDKQKLAILLQNLVHCTTSQPPISLELVVKPEDLLAQDKALHDAVLKFFKYTP